MPKTAHLQAKLEILEAILADASDYIFVFDRNGVYLYASPSGASALGLKPSDIIGKTWRELGLPSDVMERFDIHREAVFTTALPVKGYTRFPTLAGLRDYEYSVRPIFCSHSQAQAAVCIVKDVTAFRHVEEPQEWTDGIIDELSFRPPNESDGLQLNLLRDPKSDQDLWETEGQLRVVADALPGLIAYVDAQLRYRFNNKSFWDWFGLSPQEMRGRHMKEFLGDATYEGIRPYVEAVLAGHTVRFEQITSCKDASNRHVTVCYIPDLTAGGKVRGFFAVIRDITAEKEREEKEREHLLELSHAARLATVGEMATEIAHEINQPLAAIANYSSACLQLMPAEQTSQPIRKWLESINVQAKRASQIVHRLRSFVSKGRIKRTAIDLNTLVREMADFTQIETRKHGITVKLELSRTPCRVVADKVLVEQVLINLIRNAIEALAGTDCQGRRLWIKTTHQGDSIAVAVCDNGLGIPPELGERIFASFVTTKANGLGMGLAISRSIIEANGGKLWASSSLSEGTVFTFTLPLAGGEGHVTSTTTHGLRRR